MTQYLSQGSLAQLLLRAFLWGVMLGIVYSVFGIRRAAFQKLRIPWVIGAILLHTEDLLFCIAGAAGLSILYFATTRGVLRGMAIPVLGLGILTWRLSGGRLVEVCTDAILRLLARSCRWIAKRIFVPLYSLLQTFCRRVQKRITDCRQHRFNRKLNRISQTATLRYNEALKAACLVGTLPDPWGKQNRGKRSRKNVRQKRNRKESSK